MTDKNTITLPREVVEKAVKAFENGCPPTCENGMVDSGGFHPWGQPALVPCPACLAFEHLRTHLAAPPDAPTVKDSLTVQSRLDAESFREERDEARALLNGVLQDIEALRRDAEQPKPEPVVWWDVNKPLDYLTRCENGTTFHNRVIMPRHAVAWAYTNSPENIEALRRDAFRKGFYAGFAATGEGWNGEYPFQNKNRPIAGDPSVEAAIDAAMKEGT